MTPEARLREWAEAVIAAPYSEREHEMACWALALLAERDALRREAHEWEVAHRVDAARADAAEARVDAYDNASGFSLQLTCCPDSVDHVRHARRARDAAEARVAALLPYVQHVGKLGCRRAGPGVVIDAKCTCGLDAALEGP